MTTWLCCDDCGVMSFAECADGWMYGDAATDKHYCPKCRSVIATEQGREFAGLPPEHQGFAGLSEHHQPKTRRS